MPIQIPVGAEDQFKGVVDLVDDEGAHLARRNAGREVRRSSRFRPICSKRPRNIASKMIEAVSEFDDVLFEKFVEGAAITNDEIMARHPQGDHRA